ncbi:sulfatase/phosphatase domain-containing protein [Puniceicoccus vermicola]|uniref:sulfatase/phosphatase domain-containing protein n=1 Tax=Puniceicoccus vermicola TaxID=388746 RepID=UPI001C8BE495
MSPVLNGATGQVQNSILVECRPNREHLNQITLVTTPYKLILTQGFSLGELYDLRNDPDQYENLWTHPEHQKTKTDLLEKLIRKRMDSEPHFQPRTTFG